MAYQIKNGYLKSLKVEKSLYENFDFLYSEDNFSRFVINCLQKAIEKKDFFEFCMFDDVDDFKCNRSLLIESAKGGK